MGRPTFYYIDDSVYACSARIFVNSNLIRKINFLFLREKHAGATCPAQPYDLDSLQTCNWSNQSGTVDLLIDNSIIKPQCSKY